MKNQIVKYFVLAMAAIGVLAVSFALGTVNVASAAQAGAKVPTSFEVASVKLVGPEGVNRPGMFMNFGAPCGFTGLVIQPKRLQITGWPYTFIQMAYGKKGTNCREPELLTGGPEWIRTERYDIDAVLPEGTPTYTPGQLAQRDAPALQVMFQTLLAERFKLKVHSVTKEVQAYVLTVTKPKFTASAETDQPARQMARLQENGQPYTRLVANKATMADLANMLAQALGTSSVQDKTNLTGQFNITLEFDANGVTRPTIATVLQEIGLKVETTKVPAEGWVIDSVEKPSDN